MKGHNCVAIASDKRFGVEMSTISNSVSKLFEYGNNIILGMSGLSTDISSLYIEHDLKHFRSRVFDNKFKLFKLQRNSMMTTYQFMNFVSSTLYSRRFSPYFVEPVLCGIDHDGESRIASTDLIGCINYADDFVVSGTASNSLYGICESYFEPNLVLKCIKFFIDSRTKMRYSRQSADH